MSKRVMSWVLAVALMVGSLMPQTTVFAAEDVTGTAQGPLDQGDIPADPEDVVTDEVLEVEKEVIALKLRQVDLMYGEDPDNEDGHLDKLFSPEVSGKDPISVSYKFIENKEDFDPESEAFEELSEEDRIKAFEDLEQADISKLPAGSKVYVVAMATVDDGKRAFATAEVNIVKRPLTLAFPESEEISVSQKDYPDGGVIVVSAGSEVVSEITVTPVTEYVFEVGEEKTTVQGTQPEKVNGVPKASELISGDISFDVSGVDLLTEGYQDAPVTFTANEDLLANFSIDEKFNWPVLVIAAEDAETEEENAEETAEETTGETMEALEAEDPLLLIGGADPELMGADVSDTPGEKVAPTGIVLKDYFKEAGVAEVKANSTIDIRIGETRRIVAEVTPSNAYATGIVYVSSNPKVISVDQQGNVKAIAKSGMATIDVSTTAKNSKGAPMAKKSFKVHIIENNLNIKSAKFANNNVTVNFNTNNKVELKVLFDKNVNRDNGVTWTVDVPQTAHFGDGIANATDGESVNTLVFDKPGRVVVTANICGVKYASCTVTCEGTADNGKIVFYKGKYATGFVAQEPETNKVLATGNAALKVSGANIKYFDSTNSPVKGVVRIGKKLYLFDSNCNLVRGNSAKTLVEPGVIVNTLGEVQTGWIVADGEATEAYYSEVNGSRIVNFWAPKGKGYTWIDMSGQNVDDKGVSLSVDGVHTITIDGSANDYYFKGGIRQHGFAYFDEKGNLITAKKAYWMGYFDAASGVMYKGQFFTIGNKMYYANSEGYISVDRVFKDEVGYSSKWHYADSTGAIVMGPRFFTDKDKVSHYIYANGDFASSTSVAVGGRIYRCDSDGKILGTGDETTIRTYYYMDSGKTNLYSKLVNPKNVSAGSYLYSDYACTKKVTNAWIRPSATDRDSLYVDGSGKLVSGFVKIDGKTYFFDPENGCKLVLNNGDNSLISYKGKNYICDENGVLCTDTGTFIEANLKYYRVKNSSGVLMTGFQTIGGKKYFFSADGYLVNPINGKITIDLNKEYAVNPDYKSNDPSTWFIYAPGKVVIAKYGIYNKDGSVFKDGWITIDGKKCYAVDGNLTRSNEIYKISGKYYAFNDDHSLYVGWLNLTNPHVVDLSAKIDTSYTGEFWFHCNNSGVLDTGWKTIDTIESGERKKIYFDPTGTSTRPVGALVQNTDLKVGGKLYRFASDGSVDAGSEGFVSITPVTKDSSASLSYIKADGTMARGRTLVKTLAGSYYYYFSLTDGVLEKDVIRKTGNKWYYYDKNGVMSTNFSRDAGVCGERVVANFNTDGSIKNFVYRCSPGRILKNDYLKMSDTSYCVIGSNGLPVTGIVKLPGDSQSVFVETDGRQNFIDKEQQGFKLRKVGSKYYMTLDGVLFDRKVAQRLSGSGMFDFDPSVDGSGVHATELMFSQLPEADRKVIKKYAEMNATLGAPDIFMMVNSDGSVGAGTYNTPGGTIYTNKYGICKDTLSIFFKHGGWKISRIIGENHAGSRIFYAAQVENNGHIDPQAIRISWDEKGNLLPIVHNASGKNVNGYYLLLYGGPPVLINLKNGRVSTGSMKKYTSLGHIVTTIDGEYGIGVLTNMSHAIYWEH